MGQSDQLLDEIAGPSGGGPAGEPVRIVVTNEYPVGEIVRVGLALLGLVLGAYLLWSLADVIFLLILAILVATAIKPLVDRLRRGPFNRGGGVLVVYTAIVVAIGLPALVLAPGLIAQADAFSDAIPSRLAELRPHADQLQPRALREVTVRAIDRVRDAVRNPEPAREEQVVELGAVAATSVFEFFSVFVLAFYWLVERASIKRALLRAVPARRAKDVNTVWVEVEEKLGGWVRGQLLVMLIMGLVAGAGFFLIGLPNPALLGLAAAVGELIPLIGPFLGFLPAVLMALVTDPVLVIPVIIFAVVIQQIEGNFLVPRVMGHTVGVSPLTVMLGILIGATLYGLPGAFLAVPVAGAVQVILVHALGMEAPAQAEAHTPPIDERAARAGVRAGAPA